MESSLVKFSCFLSKQILRPIVISCSAYHSSSWEVESDDDEYSFRSRRPSYHSSSYRDSRGPRNNTNRNFRDKRSNFAGEGLQTVDWNKVQLDNVNKNLYTPSESVQNRSTEEVEQFRKIHNMTVNGSNIPNPIQKFSDFDFPEQVQRLIEQKRFESPTPIQAQGWPIVMSGRDFIGIGETGSGKTLGYTLPALVHINNQSPMQSGEGPIGLVMAPTRELVQQINNVALDTFGSMARNSIACIFGGANKNPQARSLQQCPSLCIATPGRLLDFLEMGVTDLRKCSFLVLDEADRMLDMGFEPQIRRIIDQIRPDRQTLMWTATWPKEIQDLAHEYLTDVVQLTVGSKELVANPNITQDILVCGAFEKRERFIEEVLNEMESRETTPKILVFAQTKSQVDVLSRLLQREKIRARAIHGDYSQSARDNTLNGFRSGRFSVLIATDVASRGLDVDDISLVINFDFPTDIETYIHRIGRTGRAGKTGRALSLLTEKDVGMAKELARVLQKAGIEPPSELIELMEQERFNRSKRSKGFQGYGGYRKSNFRQRL